jgi:hypothetical protein
VLDPKTDEQWQKYRRSQYFEGFRALGLSEEVIREHFFSGLVLVEPPLQVVESATHTMSAAKRRPLDRERLRRLNLPRLLIEDALELERIGALDDEQASTDALVQNVMQHLRDSGAFEEDT